MRTSSEDVAPVAVSSPEEEPLSSSLVLDRLVVWAGTRGRSRPMSVRCGPRARSRERLPAGTYVILDPAAGTALTLRTAFSSLKEAPASRSQAAVALSRSGIIGYRLLRSLPTSSIHRPK